MQRRDETDYFRRKWCESRQYFWKKENIQKIDAWMKVLADNVNAERGKNK